MLISVKAPPPLLDGRLAEGMTPTSDLQPGAPPPWIVPHCFKCKIPVERFTCDWIASPHYLPIQFSCHGQTSGTRIPREEVLHKSRHGGGLIWVFIETRAPRGKR